MAQLADRIPRTQLHRLRPLIQNHSSRREEFFGPLGVTNIRTFVDPGNPTRVGVLMDVPDMETLAAAMQTEGAAEAMAYDGVVPETLVILVEA